MPTYTVVALERLLEPSRVTDSEAHNSSDGKKLRPPPPQHIYISPALYTTPDPTPIPHTCSTASSISPSPYVVNRKRRDVLVPAEAVNRLQGFEIQEKKPQQHRPSVSDGDNMGELCPPLVPFGELVAEEEVNDVGLFDLEEECAVERDDETSRDPPRNLMSSPSCSDTTDDLKKHTPAAVANRSEFYDADEEFFSDGSILNSSPSFIPNIEVDLHAARVGLFDEIERRKRAEDALAQMHNQWETINKHLFQGGLSLRALWDAGKDAEKFCQEVVVARFVSEAIGRGQARAETKAAAEAIIESKNQEISRLRDKLQYIESVNREMFQRNQEVVEIARRERYKRKTKQRWIWSCIGVSIALGTSMLAYSYLPHMSRHASVDSSDLSDDTLSGTP